MGNIVKASVGRNGDVTTAPLYQYDYGQILQIDGIELPLAYQVHFSNEPYGSSTTSIGDADGVAIPDAYLQGGGDVYAWLYLHVGEDDGETEVRIRIPVKPRAAITNDEPTPVQQEEIDQLIAALNTGVEAAEDAEEAAGQSAEDAAGSAEDAEAWAVGKRGGEDVGSGDETYQNNSKYYAGQASASATAAAGSATAAGTAAETATQKATAAGNAQTAAETAQGKAEDAQTAAEAAQTAAETAQGKAEDAQEAIEDLGVSASTLSAGSSATVTKSVDPETGAVSLAFGIPKGDKGDTGNTGSTGATGTTFTPSVSNEGVISWSNDGGKANPSSVNIKGPAGQTGPAGQDGAPGQDATPDLITVEYSDLTFPVAEGTLCYHSGKLYKANQTISTSEDWTAAHWTETTVEAQISGVKSAISACEGDIEDLEDSVDKIINGENVPMVNYLNPQVIESGKQLKNDGTLSDNESYNVSGYCAINTEKTYAVISGIKPAKPSERNAKSPYRLVFYKSDKTFLSAGSKNNDNTYTIPENAGYLRFSGSVTAQDSIWTLSPMVEYVDNLNELSESFVQYTESPVNTKGLNELVSESNTKKTEITILAVNCGSFDYDDGQTTDEEYKANWRAMLNNSQADLFALSDCPKDFGELQDDSPIVLFGNTIIKFDNNNTYTGGLALASRISAKFIEQIDVGGEGAWRKLVSKFKITISGKEIMLYVGHYQPEQNMASIRAGQYANVIADANTNGYEYVIFAGDFNAWNVSEYAPFTTAGYIVCNGGYTGNHNTLRDIPADNIIYSSNMMEKHFEVMTGHTLNTDHSPIVATLMLKE